MTSVGTCKGILPADMNLATVSMSWPTSTVVSISSPKKTKGPAIPKPLPGSHDHAARRSSCRCISWEEWQQVVLRLQQIHPLLDLVANNCGQKSPKSCWGTSPFESTGRIRNPRIHGGLSMWNQRALQAIRASQWPTRTWMLAGELKPRDFLDSTEKNMAVLWCCLGLYWG